MTTKSSGVDARECPKSRVLALINNRVEKFADRTAFRMKDGTETRSLTFGELSGQAVKAASYFMEAGVKRGDRIAILGESCPEWAIAFFGAVRAGATIVPLDVKLTETELTSILSNCLPSLLVCSEKHIGVAQKLQQKIDSVREIVLFDRDKATESNSSHKILSELEPKTQSQGLERSEDEVALIVYTSGTTGSPKGVMTTFGNIIFQINSFEEIIDLTENDKFLSILPLNHLFELTGGFLGILNMGATVCFCHSLFPQEIIKTMREEKITGMVGVPLFFKSLKGGLEREIKKKGAEELQRFQLGLEKAAALPLAERRKLFAPILDALGGELRVLVSGGAPMEEEVANFFERLGIPMLQGYGLTETSPVISGNALRANKVGSVGKPLPGLEVKIDKKQETDHEGEILTRGPHVMRGYYTREDLTKEVIDNEGWFHTGDLGRLDEDGFLFITGRIKNMIVLGGGKKIFPEEVEACLSQCTLAKEICVIGHKSKEGFKEGTEEVVAVVVPSDALVAEHKDDAKALQKALEKELDELAEHLAPYKRPQRVIVKMDEFEKTATRKIKRNVVQSWLNENRS